MPKNKVYDHDYEWSGQENESKGINLSEKNPWNKPDWGTKPKSEPTAPQQQSSYATQPDRFGMEELQQRHQWAKPDWATMQKGSGTGSNRNDIIKDPIPKPMLKKTAAGVASGIQGASNTGGKNNTSTKDQEQEIAEMERRIEEARQKKFALEQQRKVEEEEAEAARQKHTVEESKLERARRLAKEREEARWRATLTERNLREKEQREQARLAALGKDNGKTASTSDAVWEKTQQEQQVRYQERVENETSKRQVAIDHEIMMKKQQQNAAALQPTSACRSHEHALEEYEEEIIEEYVEDDDNIEELVEDCDDERAMSVTAIAAVGSNDVDDIQRQIDELRRQLEQV
jgi:hypothetical protein